MLDSSNQLEILLLITVGSNMNESVLSSIKPLRRLFLISCYHCLLAFRVGAAEKPLAKETVVLPEQTETNLSVTVVGASGDLAKKKIFPALFALFYEGCLPQVLRLIIHIICYGCCINVNIYVHVSFSIYEEFYYIWLCSNQNDR